MTEDEKFHHHERISALHETFGRPCSSTVLALYWQSLRYLSLQDFDAAYERAARELRRPATPVEIREFARDNGRQRDVAERTVKGHLCHFHGDGEFENCGRGRPDEPSTNRTAWWCARCTYFVGKGLQHEDRTGLPVPKLVRDLADSKSIPPKETR